jgi:exopolyphosphatase/guanosine-5'-triphosphate,3'-diphosphate pyrophosphatase
MPRELETVRAGRESSENWPWTRDNAEVCSQEQAVPTAGTGLSSQRRLAAIDVGSNSIRLVVAEVRPGGEYSRLDDERESTRLGRTLDSTQQLDAAAMDATIAALRRFRKIAEGFQVDRMRAIATCAVREAENGVEFCHRARDEAGLEVEVISAHEEAQFAFRSVRQSMDIADKNVVIADIGGGSTEIILASGNHIEAIYDTDLGALRLTETYGPPGRLFGEDYERMLRDIGKALKDRVRKPPFSPHLLIGSGGTFTNLGSMLLAARGQAGEPPWGYRASRAEVRHLLDRLQKMPLKQRRSIPGLNPDRADIIVAGISVVDRLMRHFHVNTVQVHGGGVRDGLLLSMIDEVEAGARGPEEIATIRSRAVRNFAESCGVEIRHAEQVSRLAGDLFDQLAGPFHLEPHDRWLVTTAALLCDVGYLVSYEGHHKHSYQLIANSRLPGLDRRELELVANIARYHRGANPKTNHVGFARLLPEDQERVRRLVAILRVAGGLDRSHSQTVQKVEVAVLNGRTKISVISRDDAEVDLWGARRRTDFFQRVFGSEVAILPIEPAHAPAPGD